MQLYELKIIATGEVRDAEGNLISVDPVTGEATLIVNEEQAKAILANYEGEAR